MSDDTIDDIVFEEEEIHSEFFRPFAISFLWILPMSVLATWAGPHFIFGAILEPLGGSLMFFMVIGFCITVSGILGGIGGRLARSDLSPVFFALTAHFFFTLAAIVISARMVGGGPLPSQAWAVVSGDFGGVVNDCANLGGKLILSYPLAYFLAYKIVDPE